MRKRFLKMRHLENLAVHLLMKVSETKALSATFLNDTLREYECV